MGQRQRILQLQGPRVIFCYFLNHRNNKKILFRRLRDKTKDW